MIRAAILTVLLAGCAASRKDAMTAREELRRLCEDYWEASLRNNPTWATYLGDFRYNDRLDDLSEAGRDRELAEAKGFLARLGGIDLGALQEGDRVTADVLRLSLEQLIEGHGHRLWEWSVDQLSGPQANFPQLMNYHPHDDESGLVARFRAFPAYMDQYLDNLRAGVRGGRTAMRGAVERVIGQLKELLAVPPEKSVFAAREAFVPAVRESVYPACRKMLEYLESEYLPKSRERDVGIWALPGGAEAYRFLARRHTSTDASPEEIHRTGLEELRRIREEMVRIGGEDLKAFVEKLKADPKSFYVTRGEVLEGARRHLERAEAKLPQAFRRLPRAGCEVKAIEEYREKDAVGAYYYPPDDKGTRKGIFYANTYEPSTRPRFTMPALAFHEAVPGHHLQIALAMELEDLPKFRRHAGFTAYVEGWALYAERLADELGLYEDDLARFGMLTYQAWRAARLVVDTGIHHLRWTRRQAIDFFAENVALSEGEVVNEIDRYIIWPGQALAYTVGKIEIMSQRDGARRALGPRFDLAEFHDVVLRNGAVPLSTLRRLVGEWVAYKK